MAYTKLFDSLIHSTVWQEPATTKVVWVTMLAMSDYDGYVMASVPGLAKAAGVSLSECEAALQCFLSPDPYSRTTDYEGRRIAEIDGGWELLNNDKYRQRGSAEDKRERERLKKQRQRARKRGEFDETGQQGDTGGTRGGHPRTSPQCPDNKSKSKKKSESKKETSNTDTSKNGTASATPLARELFNQFWNVVHLKKGKEAAFKAFDQAVKRKAGQDGTKQQDAARLITEAMGAFAESPEAAPADRSPIHPTTWLNQGRYDDDRSTWQANGKPKTERVKF